MYLYHRDDVKCATLATLAFNPESIITLTPYFYFIFIFLAVFSVTYTGEDVQSALADYAAGEEVRSGPSIFTGLPTTPGVGG
jgi:hypothetical protein